MRVFIILLCCLGCNTNTYKLNDYHDEIKNKNLEDLFDKTKWLLYCTNISDKNDVGYLLDDTSNTVRLYDCEIRHVYLEIKEDTVEIAPQFFYNDELVQIPVERDFTRFLSVKFIGNEPVSLGASSLYLPYNMVMRKNKEERFLAYMENKKIGNDWLRNQIKIRSKMRHNSDR